MTPFQSVFSQQHTSPLTPPLPPPQLYHHYHYVLGNVRARFRSNLLLLDMDKSYPNQLWTWKRGVYIELLMRHSPQSRMPVHALTISCDSMLTSPTHANAFTQLLRYPLEILTKPPAATLRMLFHIALICQRMITSTTFQHCTDDIPTNYDLMTTCFRYSDNLRLSVPTLCFITLLMSLRLKSFCLSR